jgi:lipid A oxidase
MGGVRVSMRRIAVALALSAAATTLGGGAASADVWGISAYGGWNGSFNSDVRFTGPNTDWTVHSVPWDGLSFGFSGGAPYYGVRLDYWPTAFGNWGLALDFNHAKVRAHRTATVNYSGTMNAAPFNGSDQVQNLFNVLEFTDGMNFVTLNALYRVQPLGMLHPYVGLGAGISIPHVEVTGNGTTVPFARTFDYEFGGPVLQGLVGLEVPVTSHFSLFGEYKLTWTSIKSPVTGGYDIHTQVVTNHLLAGGTIKFGH